MQDQNPEDIIAAAQRRIAEEVAASPLAPDALAVAFSGNQIGAVHTAPIRIESQTLNFTMHTAPQPKGH
jgi:hypothetical protein